MQNLFYNPISLFLCKLIKLGWINFLWFVCCLPIITIGASTTALYSITLKLIEDDDISVTSLFFKAFLSNFKQSTIIFIIMLMGGCICLVDFWVYSLISNPYIQLLAMFFLGLSLIYFIILIYIFPLIAKFDMTTRNMFKNAFIMSIQNLPLSILLLFLTVLTFLFIVYCALPLIIMCFSIIAFIQSFILNHIFKKYI